MKSGAEAADRILRMAAKPTAVFCFNDEMAIGAIQRLTALGLSVPNDISVAGFDDIEFAAFASPPLTTISQPTDEMGATAMKLLHRRLSGDTQVETVTLPTQLKVRASTAAPRQLD
jgi:LacI family repressor for deo operon, udp, cdd, tsx, nupC, and nupG